MKIKEIEIGLSPISGKIYIGKSKGNVWTGDKKDVTGNFIDVMLQKFNTGEIHMITANGNPEYTIEIKKISNQ